ncbi:MAB_1171c family putative transporter [Streptomyces sp. NPDC002790]|uniref:MAB_1171c family putative transporter n=1 Tax=Streptomyces sp. NPDC002790 TaxID=3154431 RepID=UPI00332AE118
MVTLAFFAALAAAIAWKVRQVVRDPRNAPLRSVTLCLVCAAASYPLAMPGGASGVDAVAGHGAAKLLQNVLLLATLFFLMCFYLHSAADEETGRGRARREAAGLVLVVAALVAIVASGPHEVLVGSFSTADMTIPQVAGFYLLAGLYMMYALGAAFWWTRRYARLSLRPHSTGLWTTAVGLASMACACAIRAVFVILRSMGGTVPSGLNAAVAALLVMSIMLFVVGVSYPIARARITAVRIWHRHRRIHHRLQPLWELLAEAYPDSVLQPTAKSWREMWNARSVHRRYHRRVVECRDGLVQVSPYLPALPGQSARDAALDSAPPEVLAQSLRDVLAAGAPGTSGTVEPVAAVPLALPSQQGPDADVEQLVALADALRGATPRNMSAMTAANHG